MSFFPPSRIFILFVCLAYSLVLSASTVDSIKYKKEWLYVYPYDQKVEFTRGNAFRTYVTSSIFIPLTALPDGKYIQFIKPKEKETTKATNKVRGKLLHGTRSRLFRHEKINRVKDGRIPYAVFHIKDGKLNGEAILFDSEGLIVGTGSYTDNLKEGTWYSGSEGRDYYTYEKGVLHGPALFEHKFMKRRKQVWKRSTEQWYENGERVKEINHHYDLDNYTRIEKILVKEDGSFAYKKFENEQLIESGFMDKNGACVGTCFAFYPETGQKKATLTFSKPFKMERDEILYFWCDNLSFEDSSHLEMEFAGLSSYGIYLRDGITYQKPVRFNSRWRAEVLANVQQFYPSGQKMMAFRLDCGRLFLDTLFHANGKPKYVVFSDSSSSEYVAQYFDEKGFPYKEIRSNWIDYDRDADKRMVYKGHTLRRNYGERNYTYLYTPAFDSITNVANKSIYTYLVSDGKRILEETFYEPGTATQTTRFDFREQAYEPLYSLEILKKFNADYTHANITETVLFTDRFKTVCSYEIDFTAVHPISERIPNLYWLEQYCVGRLGVELYDMVRRYGNGKRYAFNYIDPMVSVSNLETTYYLDGNPITSAIEISFNAKKPGLKSSTKKIQLNVHASEQSLEGNYGVFDYDRFGLQSGLGQVLLLPDLFSKLPAFYEGDNLYSIYDHDFQQSFTNFSSLEGALKNGKIDGNWTAFDDKKQILMTVSFKEGVPAGEARFFATASSKSYLYQKTIFKEGLPDQILFYTGKGDSLLYLRYEHGEPIELKQYVYQYDMLRPELTLLKTGTFKNGKLVKVSFDQMQDDQPQQAILCEGEVIHGPIVLKMDSGHVDHGKFTGVNQEPGLFGKVKYNYVYNDLLVKTECITGENQLNWRMLYDTSFHKKYPFAESAVRFFPFSKITFDTTRSAFSVNTDEASFESWYANGAKHASGELVTFMNKPQESGIWNYYDPSSTVLTKINYYKRLENLVIDSTDFNDWGELSYFKNDSLKYVAHILSIEEQYNCFNDETYEIRVLYIKHDVDANGKMLPRPTRYHYNYYDVGSLQSEGQLVNGLPHGLWKFYDSEGGLMAIGQFERGKKQGAWYYGDLTGFNFLGSYCINPDLENLEEALKELKADLDLKVTTYDQNRVINTMNLLVYKNE